MGCRFWSVSEPSHSPKSGSYSILRKYWLPRSSLPTSSPLVNRSASLCWAFPSLCVSLAPEPNHFDRLMMTHQLRPRDGSPSKLHLGGGGGGGDALKIQSVKNNVSHEKRPPHLDASSLPSFSRKRSKKPFGLGGRTKYEGGSVGGTMAATQMARFKSREYLDLVKSIGECKSKIEEDAIMKNEVGSAARPPEFRHRYFFYPVIPSPPPPKERTHSIPHHARLRATHAAHPLSTDPPPPPALALPSPRDSVCGRAGRVPQAEARGSQAGQVKASRVPASLALRGAPGSRRELRPHPRRQAVQRRLAHQQERLVLIPPSPAPTVPPGSLN